MTLDPRINPYRPDLAADFLKAQVRAERYEKGTDRQVRTGRTVLREKPDATAPKGRAESELLHGEIFTVYEEKNGWCWGQNRTDGYVGYVAAGDLSTDIHPATHIVATLKTHVYAGPSLRTEILDAYSLGSSLASDGTTENGFLKLATGGWVYARHAAPKNLRLPDFVETARLFLDTPYVWGGRSAEGIDCSGLVQTALALSGIAAPRDTDLQESALTPKNDGPPERGDIVFFPGHVGIMDDAKNLIHANAHHMKVVVEPLEDVIGRLKPKHEKPVTAVRRPQLKP